MAKIYLEDTPIYTQLRQEYAAREKFVEIFGPEEPILTAGETHKVRGGSLTVFGNPIAPRDA